MIRLDDTESAFRRGYTHGALFVIQRLREGWTVEQLAQFVDDALLPWRASSEEGEVPPPSLGDYVLSRGRFVKRNPVLEAEDEADYAPA